MSDQSNCDDKEMEEMQRLAGIEKTQVLEEISEDLLELAKSDPLPLIHAIQSLRA